MLEVIRKVMSFQSIITSHHICRFSQLLFVLYNSFCSQMYKGNERLKLHFKNKDEQNDIMAFNEVC